MPRPSSVPPDCDVTVVLRVCDDEERIGHVLTRIAAHLRSLKLSAEILVADEGSGDNTAAVVTLQRRRFPEIALLHADPLEGYRQGCALARGRAILLYDARWDAPLAPLGFALARLAEGRDVVSVSGRYLVLRRTRAWRTFDALDVGRDPVKLERRLLRRGRALGLVCEVTHPPRRRRISLLRAALAPLAFARS